MQILKQFRKNNQSIAVILGETGGAVGVLTLDEIIDDIFEANDEWASFGEIAPKMYQVALDRAFPGDMLLDEFNKQYQMKLHYKQAKTLAQAMELALGHMPVEGEVVRIDQFELEVEESYMLSPKTIIVKTLA